MNKFKSMSHGALVQGLRHALSTERLAIVDFMLHLDEYESRGLHEIDGYSSLFKYLVNGLNLSEPAAAKRLTAMRLMRRWPMVSQLISSGQIHLTGLYTLSKHLNDGNHVAVLEDCFGRSKTWIDAYLGREFGANVLKKPRRDLVRVIAPSTAGGSFAAEQRLSVDGQPKLLLGPDNSFRQIATPVARVSMEIGEPPPIIGPNLALTLTEDSTLKAAANGGASPKVGATDLKLAIASDQKAVRLSADLSEEAFADLQRARDLLGAKDFGTVIAKALKSYLNSMDPRRKKKRAARVVRPKSRDASEAGECAASRRSRYIPQAVRLEVTQRDQARCTYVGPGGCRCGETFALQFDHQTPFARGGGHDVDNLRLLCGAHNRMAARQAFGAAFVAEKMRISRVSGAVKGGVFPWAKTLASSSLTPRK